MRKTSINAPTKRLCEHVDLFPFSSKGKAGLMSDSLYASGTLCGDCRDAVKALLSQCPKAFYALDLPRLCGTPRAVGYAMAIRKALIRQVGPVMARLKQSDEPYAKLALAAYEMMFKIASSHYWIDRRDEPLDYSWVIAEIEALMRKPSTSFIKHDPSSAYGYWLVNNSSVIRAAKASAGILGDTPGATTLLAVIPSPGQRSPDPVAVHA